MNRLMLVCFLFATATAHGLGTLELGEPKVEGNRITIPVLLGGDLGGGVSAMDFRFRYNPAVVQPVSVVAGTAAQNADKRVMSNLQTPGEYAVVMMGFNQTSCGPGEAVNIVFQRLQSSSHAIGLSLNNATMSSVDGNVIPSRVLPWKSDFRQPDESDDNSDDREPPVDRTPDTEQSVIEDPGAPSGAIRDAMMSQSPVSGASNAGTADSLKEALQSAVQVRGGIETPEAGAETVAGGNEEGLGEPGETTEMSGVAEGNERMTIAGLAAPKARESGVLPDKTVETQSGASAAGTPGRAAGGSGYSVAYAFAAAAVVALIAGIFWRRSRLIG